MINTSMQSSACNFNLNVQNRSPFLFSGFLWDPYWPVHLIVRTSPNEALDEPFGLSGSPSDRERMLGGGRGTSSRQR